MIKHNLLFIILFGSMSVFVLKANATHLSSTVLKDTSQTGILASAFANPCINTLDLNIKLWEEGKVQISIYDIKGNKTFHTEEFVEKSKSRVSLNLADLPKGSYLVEVRYKDSYTVKHLIKRN